MAANNYLCSASSKGLVATTFILLFSAMMHHNISTHLHYFGNVKDIFHKEYVMTLPLQKDEDTPQSSQDSQVITIHRSNNNSKDEPGAESSANHTTLRPCHIAVENKADFHYEVIESAIMQYPLPWDKFNCSKQHAIVDVALSEMPGRFTVNEKESWQHYFETHLAGTTRPRSIGDGAVMHFSSIQKYSNYSRVYDAIIGVSCDCFDIRAQLNKGENQFCVLHGTVPDKITSKGTWENYKKRVCWVNPMFPCYFIPSDLPQFKREKFQKGDKLRLCLKGSSPITSLQYVFDGVKSLQKGGDDPNVEIIIVGRKIKQLSERISLENNHNMTRFVDENDFYKFQEAMSKCHALLPLMHPWEKDGKKYFPRFTDGKLSGFISQSIGLKLPILVHEEIRSLYGKHFDAPVWSYLSNSLNDTQSFIDAFGEMVKQLPGYLEHESIN